MRKIIRKMAFLSGCLIILAIIIASFMAYLVSSSDEFGRLYDGLGRELATKPSVLQTIFGQDRWAGLGWRIIDVIWFFGGFYLAFKLLEYSGEK